MKSYTAGPNDDGMRLSRFVKRVTHNLPDTLMHKSFRNRRVKVNGKRAAPDTRLAASDVVELYLNDEFFADGGPTTRPAAAGPLPPFGVCWQDADLAVLYKPPGVLSHRDAGADPTLLDAFTQWLVDAGEYRPNSENTFAPALCNRLDRGTEGLVIAAKTAPALRDMNEIIRLGLLHKSYLCVCLGAPPAGLHHAFLLRDRQAKTVSVSLGEVPGAKPITTEVEVLERKGSLALCGIQLHTGRTHQIRAHLAFLGAPVLGDAKYGDKAANARYGLRGQLLCAARLRFAKELPDGPLAHLAGRQFEADDAQLPKWWAACQ